MDSVTVAAGNTPAGCDVSRKYEHLKFAQCSHTEPDATNKFHLEVNSFIYSVMYVVITA